jgi:hypothetical protein
MKKLIAMFTAHPESVGETYFQHMGMAFSFSLTMLLSAFAGLVHGVFPFLFVKTGSSTITRLYERMVSRRNRMVQPDQQA